MWSRYRARNYRDRRTVFVPASASTVGELLRPLGAGIGEGLRLVLVGAVEWRGIERTRAWAGGELPEGVRVDDRGHYLDGHYPTLRYVMADGGQVEIMQAGTWYGEGDYSCADAAAVWTVLAEHIGQTWDGAVMLSTPATLGRDLFCRGLGRREFPVLPTELQELIRSTSGQGRIETMPARAAELPALVELDGRMMYAGCLSELGHGIPVHDDRDVFEPYARGRYRVTFTVPADWCHVGLLGVHDSDGGWWWPSEPGWTGTTWCDGAELLVAQRAGWSFTVRERLLYPEHGGRPLDSWARSLLRILERAQLPAHQQPLLRSAVRAIILHTVGAFAGRTHKLSRSGPEVPAGAQGVTIDTTTGLYQWWEPGGQAWPELAHPEWSAAIWGRARARLLDAPTADRATRAGMLSVPAANVVACRTDAIYLTAAPAWPDDGRVGRFTLRRHQAGPMPWPANNVELLALKSRQDGPTCDA